MPETAASETVRSTVLAVSLTASTTVFWAAGVAVKSRVAIGAGWTAAARRAVRWRNDMATEMRGFEWRTGWTL